jgi:hypothetical protein
MYNILESKILFKESKPIFIAVLVEFSPSDIRCVVSDTNEKSCYYHIKWFDVLNYDLLQAVAGYGMITDYKKHFPKAMKYFKKSKS